MSDDPIDRRRRQLRERATRRRLALVAGAAGLLTAVAVGLVVMSLRKDDRPRDTGGGEPAARQPRPAGDGGGPVGGATRTGGVPLLDADDPANPRPPWMKVGSPESKKYFDDLREHNRQEREKRREDRKREEARDKEEWEKFRKKVEERYVDPPPPKSP